MVDLYLWRMNIEDTDSSGWASIVLERLQYEFAGNHFTMRGWQTHTHTNRPPQDRAHRCYHLLTPLAAHTATTQPTWVIFSIVRRRSDLDISSKKREIGGLQQGR